MAIPKQQSENEQPKISKYKKDDKPQTPEDQLKLAMWFIGKIGSPDAAVAVMNAACTALKQLEKPSQ